MSIAKPKKIAKSFNCPSCGGMIDIRASGHSITAVCKHCSSVIDVNNESYKIIEKTKQAYRDTFLEIGEIGNLFGIDWEVIGYVEKRDELRNYRWEEYLLFNPYHGFRFLVNASGHWNFIKVIKSDVIGLYTSKQVKYNDTTYRLFLTGDAIVNYVKGEFYWRVKKGEAVRYADYIAPPYMLSAERNDEEINLTLGEYIKPKDVKTAFGIEKRMPRPESIAANQPRPYQKNFKKTWAVTAIALILVTFIQFAYVLGTKNVNVINGKMHALYDSESKAYKIESTGILDKFTIPEDGNVLIQTSSSVDNDWAELEVSLINIYTDVSYDTKNVMEYYHGVDTDGPWSEGSRTAMSFIPAVPEGDYELLINIDTGAFRTGANFDSNFILMADVPDWSNYWLVFFLILIRPVFMSIRRTNFESKRWENSDGVAVGAGEQSSSTL